MVLSLPMARQPSGYSSASFYDLSSLPSLAQSTTDPDFVYSSPSESTSFSEDASPADSARSSSSLSSASVSSLVRTAKPSADSSFHSERPSSAESGPTLEQPRWAASGDAASFGHSSGLEEWVVDSDSPRLSWDGDPAAGWPSGHNPSGTASLQNGRSPIMASTASSLASGPSELPQRATHPGEPRQLSSEDESDLEGPVRFVVYSPHIRLKDLRGECSCWQEKKKLL